MLRYIYLFPKYNKTKHQRPPPRRQGLGIKIINKCSGAGLSSLVLSWVWVENPEKAINCDNSKNNTLISMFIWFFSTCFEPSL